MGLEAVAREQTGGTFRRTRDLHPLRQESEAEAAASLGLDSLRRHPPRRCQLATTVPEREMAVVVAIALIVVLSGCLHQLHPDEFRSSTSVSLGHSQGPQRSAM